MSDLRERGYKEVTLLGQNVNSYRAEFSTDNSHDPADSDRTVLFPELLRLVAREARGCACASPPPTPRT